MNRNNDLLRRAVLKHFEIFAANTTLTPTGLEEMRDEINQGFDELEQRSAELEKRVDQLESQLPIAK